MWEQFILGVIQGIAEWLPISSEGMILLAKNTFLHSGDSFGESIRQALYLHLGTFFAALIYFRADVGKLLKGVVNFRGQDTETRNIFVFLFLSTLISGCLGLLLLKTVEDFAESFTTGSKVIVGLIGLLLIGTGFLELRAKHGGYRHASDLRTRDGVILGITQGFAALPGFSRSGLTVSALLLCKFDRDFALRLSFLMSLPIVLAGNIVKNWKALFEFSPDLLVGVGTAFVFGLATIHLLLKVAKKINFGIFVIVFGILTLISTLI
ncbi:MAG: undecaprenyl-diphosphate phosphatase [Candidatus Omnitrophica bacterium]|nr:undecaprenyl-diphosphate phosphatase [Candidatus Omnitrophota bacterium]MCB9719635.1 undecaprenyl-diphosphate phosphatase [Candidatus Omnitrophota bacterium]